MHLLQLKTRWFVFFHDTVIFLCGFFIPQPTATTPIICMSKTHKQCLEGRKICDNAVVYCIISCPIFFSSDSQAGNGNSTTFLLMYLRLNKGKLILLTSFVCSVHHVLWAVCMYIHLVLGGHTVALIRLKGYINSSRSTYLTFFSSITSLSPIKVNS